MLLRNRLLESGSPGVVLSTDELFPLTDAEGTEVPSYQAYLCLAWFRESGLVEQEGRQGYRLKDVAGLADDFDDLWQRLPE